MRDVHTGSERSGTGGTVDAMVLRLVSSVTSHETPKWKRFERLLDHDQTGTVTASGFLVSMRKELKDPRWDLKMVQQLFKHVNSGGGSSSVSTSRLIEFLQSEAEVHRCRVSENLSLKHEYNKPWNSQRKPLRWERMPEYIRPAGVDPNAPNVQRVWGEGGNELGGEAITGPDSSQYEKLSTKTYRNAPSTFCALAGKPGLNLELLTLDHVRLVKSRLKALSYTSHGQDWERLLSILDRDRDGRIAADEFRYAIRHAMQIRELTGPCPSPLTASAHTNHPMSTAHSTAERTRPHLQPSMLPVHKARPA